MPNFIFMYKNYKNILSYFISGIILMIMAIPFLAQAQGGGDTSAGGGDPIQMNIKIENPFNCGGVSNCTLQTLIETIVKNILMPIGGVIAVLMIMYAGFLFVTARGNTGQLDKAKDALLYAVIGAAILLGAWVISQAIGTTINSLKS
jgi:hypothetical protein